MERCFVEAEVQALLQLSTEELLKQPYLYLQRLTKIPLLPAPQDQPTEISPISSALQTELVLSPEAPQSPNKTETTYLTNWGCLTFEEIYERSYRYAYALLYRSESYPAESIEDGLQTAYFKLWQRLEQEPNLLAERPMAWLGKFLFNIALHTGQREKRLANRQYSLSVKPQSNNDLIETLSTSAPSQRPHSHESRQTDMRIDLERAIHSTAQALLNLPTGKEQDRALWALYGMMSLQVHVTKISQLFRVNHRAMKQAYTTVEVLLRGHLADYAPKEETRPIHKRGQKTLPYQDMRHIREQNSTIRPERFQQMRSRLLHEKPDTLERDLLALAGIEQGISARQQARQTEITAAAMQRAYERIHLLLASEVNPSVSPRRMEKKHRPSFQYQDDDAEILQSLANALLIEEKSQERLIALYAYICNLGNRPIARHFQVNEASLRRYRQQIHERISALRQERSTAGIQGTKRHRSLYSSPKPPFTAQGVTN